MKQIKVVVLEDMVTLRTIAELKLNRFDYVDGYVTGDVEYALTMKSDVMLLDYDLQHDVYNGDSVAQFLKEFCPETVRVSYSGGCMRERENTGLYDYVIAKDTKLKDLDYLLYSLWEDKYQK